MLRYNIVLSFLCQAHDRFWLLATGYWRLLALERLMSVMTVVRLPFTVYRVSQRGERLERLEKLDKA